MAKKEYIDRHALKNDGHLCWHDGKGNVYYEVDHAPTADVVEKEQYDHVLALAQKMHTWIFLNTGDEQAVYDEIGLTDEDNTLLGYGGRLEFSVNKE